MEKRKEITQKMETVAKKTDSTFFLGGRWKVATGMFRIVLSAAPPGESLVQNAEA